MAIPTARLIGDAILIALVSIFWAAGTYLVSLADDKFNLRLSYNARIGLSLLAATLVIWAVTQASGYGALDWCAWSAARLTDLGLKATCDVG